MGNATASESKRWLEDDRREKERIALEKKKLEESKRNARLTDGGSSPSVVPASPTTPSALPSRPGPPGTATPTPTPATPTPPPASPKPSGGPINPNELQLPDNPVLRERVLEDLLLLGQLQGDNLPKVPPHAITEVVCGFDIEGDFVIMFETRERRYAFVVLVENTASLGWKECQAIHDVLKLSERGTAADNINFRKWEQSLRKKYGQTNLTDGDGRLNCVLKPGRGEVEPSGDAILRCQASFPDGNFLLRFETSSLKFEVLLVTSISSGEPPGLSVLECQCMAQLVDAAETGDQMSNDKFMALCAKLTMDYNLVSVEKADNVYAVKIITTRLESFFSPSPLVRDWLEKSKKTPKPQSGPSACPQYSGVTVTAQASASGGQAVVYKGTLDRDGRVVAVKVYKDKKGLEDCRTEIKALMKIGSHPNVISFIEFFEEPLPCVVMEFIEGENLMDTLRLQGAFPVALGIRVAQGIAAGLHHLHRVRFVHRDVKSLNIMITPSSQPILIDMGLGKETEVMKTYEVYQSAPKGTLLYIAPEMLALGEWSTATDVYAYGIVLWEIFSGKMPYDDFEGPIGPMIARILDKTAPLRPSLSLLPPTLEPRILSLIQACWHPVAALRPRMDRVLAILQDPDSGGDSAPTDRATVVFRRLDPSGTGRLTKDVFVGFLREVDPSLTREHAERVFAAVDTNHNGFVDLPEFMIFWSQLDEGGLTSMCTLTQKRVALATDIRERWSVEDVVAALRREGLERYEPAFLENRIHGPLLMHLSSEEFTELGVQSPLHRRRIAMMHLPTSSSSTGSSASLSSSSSVIPSPSPAAGGGVNVTELMRSFQSNRDLLRGALRESN